eukprot:2808727-Rhodomonas_salina.6
MCHLTRREAKREAHDAAEQQRIRLEAVAAVVGAKNDEEDLHRETVAVEWDNIHRGLADAHEQVYSALSLPTPTPIQPSSAPPSPEHSELLKIWKARVHATTGCLTGY